MPQETSAPNWSDVEAAARAKRCLKNILDLALSNEITPKTRVSEIAQLAADFLEVCPNCGNAWAIHDADGACEPR